MTPKSRIRFYRWFIAFPFILCLDFTAIQWAFNCFNAESDYMFWLGLLIIAALLIFNFTVLESLFKKR